MRIIAYPCEDESVIKPREGNRPSGRSLSNIFAVPDGGRLLSADYMDADVQNIYYKGYTTYL